jgi:hypothetical protein
MRVTMVVAGLVLIAGASFAQESAAPAPRAPTAGAPAGNANGIKPGSMVQAHGQNGTGGAYPVDGLYRENPGNGLYGAYVGDYGGQERSSP